jgi:hypothetical protein
MIVKCNAHIPTKQASQSADFLLKEPQAYAFNSGINKRLFNNVLAPITC